MLLLPQEPIWWIREHGKLSRPHLRAPHVLIINLPHLFERVGAARRDWIRGTFLKSLCTLAEISGRLTQVPNVLNNHKLLYRFCSSYVITQGCFFFLFLLTEKRWVIICLFWHTNKRLLTASSIIKRSLIPPSLNIA